MMVICVPAFIFGFVGSTRSPIEWLKLGIIILILVVIWFIPFIYAQRHDIIGPKHESDECKLNEDQEG